MCYYNVQMSQSSISEAAKLKGVSVSTLRRWESEGKLIPERTLSGHRRYTVAQLLGIKTELSLDSSFEEDLAQDVLEIITVFSARLYGSRSHKNKKIVEELRDVATRI